ncbi:hypothetical protein, partial [Streptomyces scabiei]|uniref:hypothetical protein n=2 Tax=Streptomyces scabiei TaxID=1930 RepID=UPI00131D0C1B
MPRLQRRLRGGRRPYGLLPGGSCLYGWPDVVPRLRGGCVLFGLLCGGLGLYGLLCAGRALLGRPGAVARLCRWLRGGHRLRLLYRRLRGGCLLLGLLCDVRLLPWLRGAVRALLGCPGAVARLCRWLCGGHRSRLLYRRLRGGRLLLGLLCDVRLLPWLRGAGRALLGRPSAVARLCRWLCGGHGLPRLRG